ncbi:tRNA (adenosine(37)-N6)-threonylcarbamoyltransferase complex ATPase subunit type 1 TsaE [Thioclava sp. DLFJ4-1]|uniref:tRNA (adenosine(37)-N6)-threonylcarbamoyltransferase complex ATPase subunit type 1 TsaE n=1 Tax=Thioclava sp. DLFJ4-1 TaxID=1915313 RepID=UPI0009986ADA|nr:tRNA (adenosine(37)-N6)-threonylcarbamoyltransferase complex ATPase subunit type 1 TsaE [Thioclava sp. DLFJ4-1]OOY14842.1 tRNA (adenosine(37)-N6)-threonylcarbamoyltransferase complex ATPase subunit type 1 TsaE [Thioclava sp. DLFJ4-1]
MPAPTHAPVSSEIPCLDLPDPEATERLGALFAEFAGPGDVLLLDGQIGAGKTHFARALIQTRLGVAEHVPSPTFTLVQTYEADCEIWHADLYRLTDPDEVLELGLDAAFDNAICLIEWPDRLGSAAPKGALRLRFEQTEEGAARRVCFETSTPLSRQVLEAWDG